MIAINLLPPAYVAVRAAKRRLVVWLLITAMGLAACAVGVVAVQWSMRRGESDPAVKIKMLESKLERQRKDLAGVGGELRAKLALRAAARAVGTHPDYSVLLRLLASLQRGEVVLESLAVQTKMVNEPLPAGAPRDAKIVTRPLMTVDLAGLAKSPSAVADYVLRLEATRLFSRVTLSETAARPPSEARVSEATGFRVLAQFTGEAEAPEKADAAPGASPPAKEGQP